MRGNGELLATLSSRLLSERPEWAVFGVPAVEEGPQCSSAECPTREWPKRLA
jgi:hypothetical protein